MPTRHIRVSPGQMRAIRRHYGLSTSARHVVAPPSRIWSAPRYSSAYSAFTSRGMRPIIVGSGGFGAVDVTVDPTKQPPKWLETISQLAQQGLSVYQAERLRKENLDRIRAGQPPLTDAQMKALAPTANVNVALPQDLKWAMIGGGAFLLYLLATRKR